MQTGPETEGGGGVSRMLYFLMMLSLGQKFSLWIAWNLGRSGCRTRRLQSSHRHHRTYKLDGGGFETNYYCTAKFDFEFTNDNPCLRDV